MCVFPNKTQDHTQLSDMISGCHDGSVQYSMAMPTMCVCGGGGLQINVRHIKINASLRQMEKISSTAAATIIILCTQLLTRGH